MRRTPRGVKSCVESALLAEQRAPEVESKTVGEEPEVEITSRLCDLTLDLLPGCWVSLHLQTRERDRFPKDHELELRPDEPGNMCAVCGVDGNGGVVDLDLEMILKLKVFRRDSKVFAKDAGVYRPMDELHVKHYTG